MTKRTRTKTGFPAFDHVLDGGLVPGQVVLLTGQPGVGKTTLALQVANAFATNKEKQVTHMADAALFLDYFQEGDGPTPNSGSFNARTLLVSKNRNGSTERRSVLVMTERGFVRAAANETHASALADLRCIVGRK